MNGTIFYFFHNLSHQSPGFDFVIVFLTQYFPYVIVGIAGMVLLFHHEIFYADNTIEILKQKYKEIFFTFSGSILAWVTSMVLKNFFMVARPIETLSGISPLVLESGYAFPSNHATFFMALATSLYFVNRRMGYLFAVFALIIGLTRIIAGVHFPLDILAGFLLGQAVALIVQFIAQKTKSVRTV